MWDLPGPGFKPVSLALAGGFLTTVPPGKPHPLNINLSIFLWLFGLPTVGHTYFCLPSTLPSENSAHYPPLLLQPRDPSRTFLFLPNSDWLAQGWTMTHVNQSQFFPGTIPAELKGKRGLCSLIKMVSCLLKKVPDGYCHLQPKGLTYIPTLFL